MAAYGESGSGGNKWRSNGSGGNHQWRSWRQRHGGIISVISGKMATSAKSAGAKAKKKVA